MKLDTHTAISHNHLAPADDMNVISILAQMQADGLVIRWEKGAQQARQRAGKASGISSVRSIDAESARLAEAELMSSLARRTSLSRSFDTFEVLCQQRGARGGRVARQESALACAAPCSTQPGDGRLNACFKQC